MVPAVMLARKEPFPWDYAAQPKEHVEACNACGSKLWVTLCNKDRYGFPVSAHCCHSCGLIFLSPRMTKEAYAEFYRGTYRDLIQWYTPGSNPAGEESQTRYAKKIIPLLEPFTPPAWVGGGLLLDIGGFPGVCAEAVRKHFGMAEQVTLDPACPIEAHADPASFLPYSIEDDVFNEEACYDIILCCQTVDHLLDLRGSLEKMRSLLTDDGVLWVDIVDLLYLLRQRHSIDACIKADHPFGLNEVTFMLLLAEVGFEIVRIAYQGAHIGFVCKKGRSFPGILMDQGRRNPVLANARKKEAEKWSLTRGR